MDDWKFDADTPGSPRELAFGLSRAIRTAGFNRIDFECISDDAAGATLRLSVNGQQMGEARDRQAIPGGRVGVHVFSKSQTDDDIDVRFDNFSAVAI